MNNEGHFAYAIDSRTASSSQFILRFVEFVIKKLYSSEVFNERMGRRDYISGFNGAVEELRRIGKQLDDERKLLFIFLDQFENIFYLNQIFTRIRDLFYKLSDYQVNIVFGFSWKTDLVGLTSEFPYKLRDDLSGISQKVILERFSDVETNFLLDKLSEEIRAKLRKDLKFFLSEFSQGFPWLLKKLCAHVKIQREKGVPQQEIANSLLNVEELFLQDLSGLGPEEESALKEIARLAPINIQDLGENFKAEVVQSLVNSRLIVRIGNKYDVYWDIFRDYLNTGHVPAQENFIIRIDVGRFVNSVKLLVQNEGELDVETFLGKTAITQKSFYNLAKDLKLLGIAEFKSNSLNLLISLPQDDNLLLAELRSHIRDRLKRNRIVIFILDKVGAESVLTLEAISTSVSELCPYISASPQTWRLYARRFASWMDFSDLALLDTNKLELSKFIPGQKILRRFHFATRFRKGMPVPRIQHKPIKELAVRLSKAVSGPNELDLSGFKRTTLSKSFSSLEELGFIERKPNTIVINPPLRALAKSEDSGKAFFGQSALKIVSFKTFLEILNQNPKVSMSYRDLGLELKAKLGAEWAEGTAITNIKIMLDWARFAGLAPGIYAQDRRGKRSGVKGQGELWESKESN